VFEAASSATHLVEACCEDSGSFVVALEALQSRVRRVAVRRRVARGARWRGRSRASAVLASRCSSVPMTRIWSETNASNGPAGRGYRDMRRLALVVQGACRRSSGGEPSFFAS
jgi:hypothetical protein